VFVLPGWRSLFVRKRENASPGMAERLSRDFLINLEEIMKYPIGKTFFVNIFQIFA